MIPWYALAGLPKRSGKFDSGDWAGKPWDGAYFNSPIVVQPNWGEPASISNYSYGNLRFENTSILLTPAAEMLDAVNLLPFTEAAGIANVLGNVAVYSNEVCSCCKVNSFCAKGSPCASGSLPLVMSCHNASAWPFTSHLKTDDNIIDAVGTR